MKGPISHLISPSYEGVAKDNKIQWMLKMTYDTLFYLTATLCSYFAFKDEHWFPTAAGGCGACSQIYR